MRFMCSLIIIILQLKNHSHSKKASVRIISQLSAQDRHGRAIGDYTPAVIRITAIGAHERQLFDKLLWGLVTSTIFVRC